MSILDKFVKRAFVDPLKRGVNSVVQGIEDRIDNSVTSAFNSVVRDLSQNSQNDLTSRLGDAAKKELSDQFFGTSSSEINRATTEDICNSFIPKQYETSSSVANRINRKLSGSNILGEGGSLLEDGSTMQYPENIGKYYISLKFRQYTRPNVFQRAKLEFKGAIALPIPRNLVDGVSLDVQNNQSAGMSGVIMDSVLNIDGDKNTLGNAVSSQSGALIFSYLSSKVESLSSGSSAMIGAAMGVAPNPHMQTYFKGVNMREHSFEWIFSPRNPDESIMIQNIILALKQYSLPTFSTSGVAALQYPYMCMIDLHPWKASAPLIKFKPALLKNMSIDYNPNGLPSFFAGTTLPTAIRLRLEFVETEYFTAEDFGRKPHEDGISKSIEALSELANTSIESANSFISSLLSGDVEAAASAATAQGDQASGQSAAQAAAQQTPQVNKPPVAQVPKADNNQALTSIKNIPVGGNLTTQYKNPSNTYTYTVFRAGTAGVTVPTQDGTKTFTSGQYYVKRRTLSTGGTSAIGFSTADDTYNYLKSDYVFN